MTYPVRVHSGEAVARPHGWRSRVPVVLLVLACVAAVVVAVSGAAKPLSGLHFFSSGHWVYNDSAQTAYHVDGASRSSDAEVPLAGKADPGSVVVQGDRSGYVVGKERVVEFGKSNLQVTGRHPSPSREEAFTLETNGGPYGVYRQAGTIVRYSDPNPDPINVGGPLGDPVATSNGTVWLHRIEDGRLCRLAKGTRFTSCPITLPEGTKGMLTVVADRAVFVNTSTDSLHLLDPNGLGDGVPMGVDLPEDVRVAPRDVEGRVAVLDKREKRLLLIDAKPLTQSRMPEEPRSVSLTDADYDGPASTGNAVAVVNRQDNTVETYGPDGSPIAKRKLNGKPTERTLRTGEDGRVYADDKRGDNVLVVDHNGEVEDVDVIGDDGDGDAEEGKDTKRKVDKPRKRERDRADRRDRRDRVPQQREQERRPPQATAESVNSTQQEPPPVQLNRPKPDPKPDPTPDPKPATPPGAPRSVSAEAANKSAEVSWSPPRSNGGAAVTGYRITWSGGSKNVSGSTTSTRITGLTNGRRYVFTVAARNSSGQGTGASSNAVTPKTVPTVDVTSAEQTGDGQVTLTVRVDGGGDPNVTCSVTWGSNSREMACNGSSSGTATRQLVIDNVRNGTYTFYARGKNSAGQGPRGQGTTVEVSTPEIVL